MQDSDSLGNNDILWNFVRSSSVSGELAVKVVYAQTPKTTELNKRIPKEKSYENLNITPTVKKSFVDQIKVVYWRNKIASSITNLAAGGTVTEIKIFELNSKLMF